MKAFGYSDVGKLRQRNEDAFAIVEKPFIAVISDGMGGAPFGDVASMMSVESFTQACKKIQIWDNDSITKAVYETNAKVVSETLIHPKYQGMGATLIAYLHHQSQSWIVNVGDSRAYGYTSKKFDLLSDDHTMLNEMMKQSNHQESNIDQRFKHMLTSVIGMPSGCHVDVTEIHDQYDFVLLCSDGLSNLVCESTMMDVLGSSLSIEDKTKALIAQANQAGGSDNITVIIIDTRGETYE
jgi:serine/threonine protein phosphatase PrpC